MGLFSRSRSTETYIPLSGDSADAAQHPLKLQSPITRAILRVLSSRILFIAAVFALGLFFGSLVNGIPQAQQIRDTVRESVGLGHKSNIVWTGDYFFHPPLRGDRAPAVASYNGFTNEDAIIRDDFETEGQEVVTPLFIPFTRNDAMLTQTLLSYIAAGWPREEIIIVENTGTMDANPNGLLSKGNPFYLNYDTLRGRYGVSILRTPTLLSFAQLQNFMWATARSRGWRFYYWSHQDVAVLSDEAATPYRSFYSNVLTSLRALNATADSQDPKIRWAARFYNFDWLTLVNVDAISGVGAWDPFIPYYNTDCDWYERARLAGYSVDEERVGDIYDLHKHFPTPEERFFGPEALNSERYRKLKEDLKRTMEEKNKDSEERNTWQTEKKGGKGEPWTYDPQGFQKAWWMLADKGREVFLKKWSTGECAITKKGKKLTDAWS